MEYIIIKINNFSRHDRLTTLLGIEPKISDFADQRSYLPEILIFLSRVKDSNTL